MGGITAALMAVGTGSATGLKPYLTVFMLSVAGMAVPPDTSGPLAAAAEHIPHSLANPWVAIICAILAIGDFGIDKVIGLNLPFETINSVLRPIFGALVGTQVGVNSGPEMTAVCAALGLGTATPVSLGKTGLTAGMTAAFPEPVSQVVRSFIEDFGAFFLVLAALILPALAAFFGLCAVGIGLTLFFMFRKAYRSMRTKFSQLKQRRTDIKQVRAAQLASGERVTFFQALRRLAAGASPLVAAGVATSTEGFRNAGNATAGWTKQAAGQAANAAGNAAAMTSSGAKWLGSTTAQAYRTAQERFQSTRDQNPGPQSHGTPAPTPPPFEATQGGQLPGPTPQTAPAPDGWPPATQSPSWPSAPSFPPQAPYTGPDAPQNGPAQSGDTNGASGPHSGV